MKACARITNDRMTGEEIEVHDDSELIWGPYYSRTTQLGGRTVVCAQFACNVCGHVTDYALRCKPDEDPDKVVARVAALKPRSKFWREQPFDGPLPILTTADPRT